MTLQSFFLFFLYFFVVSTQVMNRETCADGYEDCAPEGASPRQVPALGGDWVYFFQALVSTVNSTPNTKIETSEGPGGGPAGSVRRATSGICCVQKTLCLLIESYHIPSCYDKFTTDYYLPDGSYGNLGNGSYKAEDGGTANFVTGDYTLADGQEGNIYTDSPADRPGADSLPLPTPFTSSGVGSAIPDSLLGSVTSMQTMPAPSSVSELKASTDTVSNSGFVPPSITSALTGSMASETDTASNSGIVPPFITNTLAGTPSVVTGTVGFPATTTHNNSMAAAGTAPGTSGGSLITGYATPSIYPPINNLAAATVLYCLTPNILVSILAAFLTG